MTTVNDLIIQEVTEILITDFCIHLQQIKI